MFSSNSSAFVVRIWCESEAANLDGCPLWRGQIQHVGSGRTIAFQSLDTLLHFIQTQAHLPQSPSGLGKEETL
jgi:hypothetical protein